MIIIHEQYWMLQVLQICRSDNVPSTHSDDESGFRQLQINVASVTEMEGSSLEKANGHDY